MVARRYFPEEHDEIVKRQYKIGTPIRKIAENMGFSVSTIKKRVQEMGLCRNPQILMREPQSRQATERQNPIDIAFNTLAGAERRHGAFYLNGRPVRLDQLMQAANLERVKAGLPQIDVNPRWVV